MLVRSLICVCVSILVWSAASAADTAVSSLSDVVYVETLSAQSGTDVVLSVRARTQYNLRSYQFKMNLPEGISFVVDEDGAPVSEISSQRTYTKQMNYRTALMANGDLMVGCTSQLGGNYEGLTGEICTIRLHIDQTTPASLPVRIYWVKACDPQYNAYVLPEVNFSIKVHPAGDITGDDLITVADIATLIWSRPGIQADDAELKEIEKKILRRQ